MAAKIIPFPTLHLERPHDPEAWHTKPHELWTVEDSLEEARWRVRTITQAITDLEEKREAVGLNREECFELAAKLGMIQMWKTLLAEREAQKMGTALTHNGVVYAETLGRA